MAWALLSTGVRSFLNKALFTVLQGPHPRPRWVHSDVRARVTDRGVQADPLSISTFPSLSCPSPLAHMAIPCPPVIEMVSVITTEHCLSFQPGEQKAEFNMIDTEAECIRMVLFPASLWTLQEIIATCPHNVCSWLIFFPLNSTFSFTICSSLTGFCFER